MGANTSSAVMAQRSHPADDLEFFPTPGWGTRALCEQLIDLRGATVWEPACGRGHMSRVLAEYAGRGWRRDSVTSGAAGIGQGPCPFGGGGRY